MCGTFIIILQVAQAYAILPSIRMVRAHVQACLRLGYLTDNLPLAACFRVTYIIVGSRGGRAVVRVARF